MHIGGIVPSVARSGWLSGRHKAVNGQWVWSTLERPHPHTPLGSPKNDTDHLGTTSLAAAKSGPTPRR
jgi:hypothetical protein